MAIDGQVLLQTLATYLQNQPVPGTAPRILLAAQPKSASTWVSAQLSAISGLPQVGLVPAYGGREQELSELRLAIFAGQGFIACHHTRWSVGTNQLINQFGLRTVVLVRNLFDVVVSTRHHLHKEGLGGGNPMSWIEPNFLQRSVEQQLDHLIDLLVPWHLHFYLSWRYSGRKDLIWLSYEQLFAGDPGAGLELLCQQLGIPSNRAAMQGEGIKEKTRFRAGKSGGGLEELSEEQVARIRRMAAHYPGRDFSLIGL